METGFPAADSRDDFARARRNAVLARLGARLRMREGDVDVLLPFDEVIDALGHARVPVMDIGELERALAAGPGWPPVAALGLDALRQEMTAVWVSVRGASGDGPGGDQPGYDVMAQARSGLMSVTATTEPIKVGVAVTAVVTGLYAAVGAVAGLVARGRAGADGRHSPLRVEVGLLEAAVSMLVNQTSNALCAAVELPAQVAEVAGADRR